MKPSPQAKQKLFARVDADLAARHAAVVAQEFPAPIPPTPTHARWHWAIMLAVIVALALLMFCATVFFKI